MCVMAGTETLYKLRRLIYSPPVLNEAWPNGSRQYCFNGLAHGALVSSGRGSRGLTVGMREKHIVWYDLLPSDQFKRAKGSQRIEAQ